MLKIYINLFLVGLIPVALSVIFYLLKRHTKFNNLSFIKQQIVIGVTFGISSILGTVLGVDIGDGVMVNARDASPLCAGLIFGGPSGLIAGTIGGIYRFVSDYWKVITYSQVACSISTFLAGVLAFALRKYMFDNKRPTCIPAFVTALVMEVIHMTVLFLTHLSDTEKAMSIVKICTLPMIVCNAVSVALSVFFVGLFNAKKIKERRYKNISQQVQTWLLIVIVIAYSLTTMFVYRLDTSVAEESTISVFDNTYEEINAKLQYTEATDFTSTKVVGKTGFVMIIDREGKVVSDTNNHTGEYVNKDYSLTGLKDLNSLVDTGFSAKICETNCYAKVYKDTYNKNLYIVCAMPETEVYETRDNSVYINSYMEVLVFALLFVIIYELVKRLVVDKIQKINSGLAEIIDGDLNVSIDVRSSEEFSSLSNDINSTVATLKHYINEAERRIDKELEFAKNIQHSALPSVFPAYKDNEEFDIYATMDTAKAVGGDFYDFYKIGNGKLAFLVADVSGKGIPAAMFMMTAKTMLKNLAEEGHSVEEIMTIANQRLCENNEANMFVTVWMGILNYRTGHIEYVSAGHNPPFLYRENKGFTKLATKSGFVLAGMQGIKYKANFLDLNKGDRIYLYTDGVTEATTLDNKLYGEGRLLNYLNANSEKGLKDLLVGIKGDVDNFVGKAEQFDDITMLCLDYFGEVKYNCYKVNCKVEQLEKVCSIVEEECQKHNCTKKAKSQLLVAVEEIFVNICNYAYGDKGGTVDIDIGNINDKLIIRFTDSGIKFNPLEKKDPDIKQSAEEREIGGLGIYIVKKTMDDVTYQFREQKNILTIKKTIR